MANSKDSVIFYQSQVDKCRKHLNTEQFGRLMLALFDFDRGEDPEVDDDIALAFEFMSLQIGIDREKYERKCRTNRENGKLGGRPKKNQGENPTKPNGFSENPNDNENVNENVNDNVNGDEDIHDSVSLGQFGNVELTDKEYSALRTTYERVNELIDKVSVWLRGAKNDVPDHYALCVKFANNDRWPRRKVIEPVEVYEVQDPLSPEEQQEKVADMRARLNDALPAG